MFIYSTVSSEARYCYCGESNVRLQFFLPPTPVLGSVHSATVGGSLAWIQNPADRTRNLIRDRSSILGQVAEFRHQVAPTYRKCAPYSLTSVTLGGLFEAIAKPALCGTLPAPHARRPTPRAGVGSRLLQPRVPAGMDLERITPAPSSALMSHIPTRVRRNVMQLLHSLGRRREGSRSRHARRGRS